MHRLSLLLLMALCACQSSYNSKFQNEEGGFPEPSVLLKNAHGASQSVAGVGRLQGEMTCTAFLWKPDGALPESKAWALTTREPYGVWGGLSEDERATILGVRNLRYPYPAAAARDD